MTTERDRIRAEVLDAWKQLSAEERKMRPPLTPDRLDELTDAAARWRSAESTSAIPYAQEAWFNLHGWRGTVPEAEAVERVAHAVITDSKKSTASKKSVAPEMVTELASLVEMELDHLRNELARAIAPGGRASWLRIDTAEQIHTPITAETDDGPILAWDAVAADWLETRLGARETAGEMRARARARWLLYERERDLWTPGHEPTVAGLWKLWQRGEEGAPRIVARICQAVWRRDAPKLENRARWHVAAQPDLFLRSGFVHRGYVWNDRTRTITDRHGNPSNLQIINTIPTESAEAAKKTAEVIAGLHGLSKLGWYRVRAHLLARVFTAKVNGDPRPEEVIIHGGWGGFAKEVGWGGGKAPDELRELIRTAAGLRIVLGEASIPLLGEVHTSDSHPELKERPGRSARIRLRLSDPWIPTNDGTEDHRYGRWLIPSLSVPDVSAVNGRSQGPAARTDLLALIELRARCEELVREGGVPLNWRDLAEVAELSRSALDRVLDVWRGSRWVEVRPGLWTLADTTDELRGAHALLREAAAKIRAGRNGGRKKADIKRGLKLDND